MPNHEKSDQTRIDKLPWAIRDRIAKEGLGESTIDDLEAEAAKMTEGADFFDDDIPRHRARVEISIYGNNPVVAHPGNLAEFNAFIEKRMEEAIAIARKEEASAVEDADGDAEAAGENYGHNEWWGGLHADDFDIRLFAEAEPEDGEAEGVVVSAALGEEFLRTENKYNHDYDPESAWKSWEDCRDRLTRIPGIVAEVESLTEDNERASTLRAKELVQTEIFKGIRSPKLFEATASVARSLFETADSHEEGVDALRFAVELTGSKAAADLLADLDGADAVQKAHLVLMAESPEDFLELHKNLPANAPVKRRLAAELRKAGHSITNPKI